MFIKNIKKFLKFQRFNIYINGLKVKNTSNYIDDLIAKSVCKELEKSLSTDMEKINTLTQEELDKSIKELYLQFCLKL